MAKYIFKSDLSVKGIENLKKELLNYKNNILNRKVQELTRRLAEVGVEVARARAARLGAEFTGELISSIHTRDGGVKNGTAIFYIVADSDHAVFVEFGTGQMGQEAPYPYPFPVGISWDYNTGSTIREFAPGQYGWFYPKDGQWYFTQGMPARPFMYETSLELQSKIVAIAKDVFSRK